MRERGAAPGESLLLLYKVTCLPLVVMAPVMVRAALFAASDTPSEPLARVVICALIIVVSLDSGAVVSKAWMDTPSEPGPLVVMEPAMVDAISVPVMDTPSEFSPKDSNVASTFNCKGGVEGQGCLACCYKFRQLCIRTHALRHICIAARMHGWRVHNRMSWPPEAIATLCRPLLPQPLQPSATAATHLATNGGH